MGAIAVGSLLLCASPASVEAAIHRVPTTPAAASTLDGWRWPLGEFQILRPFLAPAHEYGPGHRGIDLMPSAPDAIVVAPAGGVVAFSGAVAGRTLLTIDHGQGLVTTLEPVTDPPPRGTKLAAGDLVGTVSVGGHTSPGALHFGVRENGVYINPMLLLGGIERAVLLPCCS